MSEYTKDDITNHEHSYNSQPHIKNEEQNKVIEILKQVNWQKFHNLCVNIGDELNDPQWRFLKAVFLEMAVSKYSNNLLTYVGNEQKGCDFIITSLNNVKIEMKYTENCLFNSKNNLKKFTKQITLLNSRGTNVHINLPENYSDYLLIVEMNGVAIISKQELEKYVNIHGDSLTAKIPTERLHIISKPTDIEIVNKSYVNKLCDDGKIISIKNMIIDSMNKTIDKM